MCIYISKWKTGICASKQRYKNPILYSKGFNNIIRVFVCNRTAESFIKISRKKYVALRWEKPVLTLTPIINHIFQRRIFHVYWETNICCYGLPIARPLHQFHPYRMTQFEIYRYLMDRYMHAELTIVKKDINSVCICVCVYYIFSPVCIAAYSRITSVFLQNSIYNSRLRDNSRYCIDTIFFHRYTRHAPAQFLYCKKKKQGS